MKDSLNEKLYCDFEISIGDTLNYYYNYNSITVDSIDSIPYGIEFRKEYILINGFSFYEGISNGLGLFHDFSIGIEGGVYLVCFQQNGINQDVYQLWGTPPNCGLSNSSIKEKSIISNNALIFPNPFSEQSTITFDNNYNLKYSLSLYDSQGRLVRTITDITTDNVEIERKYLTSGLYFFELRSDRQIFATGKLTIE